MPPQIIYYLICEALITDKFNINFCVVAFLLMCDFWTASAAAAARCGAPPATPPPGFAQAAWHFYPASKLPACHMSLPQVKNVSGRLMVGLRWWNEVSENGGSEWRFETLQEGQRAVDKKDSFLFWTVGVLGRSSGHRDSARVLVGCSSCAGATATP